MDDTKNMILAIVLSMLVLFGYQYFIIGPEEEQARIQGELDASQEVGDLAINPEAPEIPGSTLSELPATTEKMEPNQDVPEAKRIPIDAPRVKGSISPIGGRIDSLILKDYFDSIEPDSDNIILLRKSSTPHAYFSNFTWIQGRSSNLTLPDENTLWQVNGSVLSSETPIELIWENGQGVTFRKIISVDENYMFSIRQVIENRSDVPITLAPYGMIRRVGTPKTLGFFILYEGPLGVLDGDLYDRSEDIQYKDLKEAFEDGEGPVTITGTDGWLGFTDKYWLTSLIPDQAKAINARFFYSNKNGVDQYQADFVSQGETIPAGGRSEYVTNFFAGAKEVDLIDAYGDTYNIPKFDLAIDWGWFYFLTRPIFYLLDLFYSVVGNFGVAILLLTVLIKLLLFPLANKSYRAMSRMKKLQPKIQTIRERYTEDKVRLQQETMALYQKEKVNPAAGCLPMFLQFPVFFALYKVLFITIEMRHQPFFGWIHDLSAPDPLTLVTGFGLIQWAYPDWMSFLAIGIWPIIMGVTMYLQQKLNPQTPDPVQAKIFMFMPIFFTFILARFPVGLVIYWTWNNLLTIAQQWVIMKKEGAFDTKG